MTDASAKPADIVMTTTEANFFDRYKTPVVRSMATLCRAGLQAIPLVGGSLDTVIMDAYTRHRERREREFFDALDRGEIRLTEEQIQSNEFLHAFTACYRAALNTRQEEKIRLFIGYSQGDMEAAADDHEEFVALLNDLTYREFQVLLLLHQTQSTYVVDSQHRSMWQEFERRVEVSLGISRAELPGYWNASSALACIAPFRRTVRTSFRIFVRTTQLASSRRTSIDFSRR